MQSGRKESYAPPANYVRTEYQVTTTNVTVSTARDSNGQVLGGSRDTVFKDASGKALGGSIHEDLSPLKAAQAAGNSAVKSLQEFAAPGFFRKHWAGVAGTGAAATSGGLAIACAVAEPCGVGLAVGAGAAGVVAAIFGGIELWNNR